MPMPTHFPAQWSFKRDEHATTKRADHQGLPCWRWPTRSFVNTRTSSTACAPTRWSRRGHSGVQGEFFLAEDGTPDRQDHGGVQHVQAAGPAALRQIHPGLTPAPSSPMPPSGGIRFVRPASPAGLPLGHHAVATRHLGHVEASSARLSRSSTPSPRWARVRPMLTVTSSSSSGGAFHQPRLHRDPQPLRHPLGLCQIRATGQQDGKLLPAVTPEHHAGLQLFRQGGRHLLEHRIPARWPKVSLMRLKRSRSSSSTAKEPVCGSWRPSPSRAASSAGGGSSCQSARPWWIPDRVAAAC